MAIKIRCKRCSRRISIDEAFAGGVCRCPYCKSINNVPSPFGPTAVGQRPDAPPTGDTSGPRVAMRAGAADQDEIPVADRMVFQGVATLILVVILLGMVIVGSIMMFSAGEVENGNGENGNGGGNGQANGHPNGQPNGHPNGQPVRTNPFVTGPSCTVAGGVAFQTPVAYCIDAGGSMRNVYYYAVLMTAASVDSLGPDDAFRVFIAEEGATRIIAQDMAGRVDGAEVQRIADGISPVGVGDTIGALEEAMTFEPATIILFARKTIYAPHIAARQDVVIITVSLDGNEVIDASLADLATGQGLTFTVSQLERWFDQAD